jgi:hypothetical protein
MTKKFGFAAAAALSLTLAACGGGEANVTDADANGVSNDLVLDESLGNELTLDNGTAVDALANSTGNITE